ncbi:Ribonuclease H domain [Sesbania bispinosa]|nr:Ribonuclease H domain [Sesbania bispinosa]
MIQATQSFYQRLFGVSTLDITQPLPHHFGPKLGIAGQEALVATVTALELAHKYLHNNSILAATYSPTASVVWRSIVKAKDALKDGFSMKLGNGNTPMWYEDWTGLGKLCWKLPFVHIADTNLTVKDLWDGSTWSLSSLNTFLPDDIVLHIGEIPIPLATTVEEDTWCWMDSTAGNYSSNAGYKWLLKQDNVRSPEHRWRWIWRLPTPEKIRFMIWLTFHKSLPTKETLYQRNILQDDLCPRCSNDCETLTHCFRDCNQVQQVWNRLGFGNDRSFFTRDFNTWIIKHVKGSKGSLFLAALWTIWKWINSILFVDDNWDVEMALRRIYCLQHDYSPTSLTDGECLDSAFWWSPSSSRCHKNECKWELQHEGNSLLAELLAFKQGLIIAWERGHKKLIVESDSMEVIHLVNNQTYYEDQFGEVVRHIQQLLKKDWHVQCIHVMREANLLADLLAKLHNYGVDGVSIWDDPPLELAPDIALDMLT